MNQMTFNAKLTLDDRATEYLTGQFHVSPAVLEVILLGLLRDAMHDSGIIVSEVEYVQHLVPVKENGAKYETGYTVQCTFCRHRVHPHRALPYQTTDRGIDSWICIDCTNLPTADKAAMLAAMHRMEKNNDKKS